MDTLVPRLLSSPNPSNPIPRVLSWGSGVFGALGNGSYTSQSNPTEIDFFHANRESIRPLQVSAGWGTSMVLCNAGNVFGWGWKYKLDDTTRLAYNSTRGIFKPLIPLMQRVQTSSYISKMLFFDGAYSLTPLMYNTLPHASQIESGSAFAAAIDKDGNLYTWGDGAHAALGFGVSKDIHPEAPALVDHFKQIGLKVKQVSGGYTHLAAVTDDGDVWGFGRAEAVSFEPHNAEFSLSSRRAATKTKFSLMDTYKTKYNFSDPYWGPIVRICCAINSTLVLTSKGQVYTMGRGASGILGIQSLTNQDMPRFLDAFDGEKVTSISATCYHAAAITESGRLFTWGAGQSGQCGRYRGESFVNDEIAGMREGVVYMPSTVENLPEGFKPLKVSCGLHETAVIGEDGRAILFGWNPAVQKQNPEALENDYREFDTSVPIDDIQFGFSHYLVLTKPL